MTQHSARLARLQTVPGSRWLLVTALCLSAVPMVGSGSGAMRVRSSAFDFTGHRPERGYFSGMPWERIDMVNGNLTMTFTDLVLPGNAGMDVRITRTYNHQAATQWNIGFVGVPIAIDLPPEPYPQQWTPMLKMGDGSSKRLHIGVSGYTSPEYWITEDFWRYDPSTKKLALPNGWVASYLSTTCGDGDFYLDKVEDPFGNKIEPEWNSSCKVTDVVQTVNDSGATRQREVESRTALAPGRTTCLAARLPASSRPRDQTGPSRLAPTP